MSHHRILFIDAPGFKPLPRGESLRLISGEALIEGVTDINAAMMILQRPEKLDMIVANGPLLPVFETARRCQSQAETILVTESPMARYSAALGGYEETLLDHVIANCGREAWAVLELRTTIAKIVSRDIFGIEKYLLPGTRIQRLPITGSAIRDAHNAAVLQYAEECGMSSHLAKTAFGITEELLMNAIYDAPVASGSTRYAELPRSAAMQLDPEHYGELSFASDGKLLAIAAADPFGALKKEKLLFYLKKVLKRRDSVDLIDTKKGGAGLGLFKILYSSHGIICNVEAGARTEIMAIINTEEQLRDFAGMARSIHFFSR